MLAVLNAGQQTFLCRLVAGQFVGDHDTRRTHLLLQQFAEEALSRRLVAPALHQNVEHEPILIDRAPEPAFSPGNLHRDLVQMPFIASPG